MIKKFYSRSAPFFVAEISANHNGSLNHAKKLIKTAKNYGADAVKLQTYTPDTMTIKSNREEFKIKNGIWKGQTLWDLYDKAQTPFGWHKELFSYAKKIKMTCFSTPFDETAVDLLEKLNCPIYKVASFEMTDLSLIKKIARTKKPMIISTGMANLNEISLAYSTAKNNGAKNITLLYCVSNYPSKIKDFNLKNINILKRKFKCKVGFSDHSKNNIVSMLAISCGAEVIEKHIALDKQSKGLDVDFSLKGQEIKKFRDDIDEAYLLLGKEKFLRKKTEQLSKKFRRSIFVIKDVIKGEKFSKLNISRLRPGLGLSPVYYEKILNKKSPYNLKKNTPLKKIIIEKLKIKEIV